MEKDESMKKIITSVFAVATFLGLSTGLAYADKNTDKVVAEMSKGDVAKICKGGKKSISEASAKATTKLAKKGKIKGDFKAIGGEAGTAFYKKKCA
jgi:hypothetical protein